jgi:hypothetical protein
MVCRNGQSTFKITAFRRGKANVRRKAELCSLFIQIYYRVIHKNVCCHKLNGALYANCIGNNQCSCVKA